MGYKRITYEDRKLIEELVEFGESARAIAQQVGVSPAAIYTELRRCEAGNYSADEAQKSVGGNSEHGRRITYEERTRIERLLHLGRPVNQIAHALNMHPVTIYREINKGGGREKYSAELAQKTFRQIRQKDSRKRED